MHVFLDEQVNLGGVFVGSVSVLAISTEVFYGCERRLEKGHFDGAT